RHQRTIPPSRLSISPALPPAVANRSQPAEQPATTTRPAYPISWDGPRRAAQIGRQSPIAERRLSTGISPGGIRRRANPSRRQTGFRSQPEPAQRPAQERPAEPPARVVTAAASAQ